jgi:uncharacterized RDD family membrane protein YckC
MITYATFGRRAWAWLLTLLVDLIVLGTMRGVTDGGDVLAPFGFWYALHHVGLVTEGGTIGQRLAGLRVVRVDGTRVGPMMAGVRELSRLFLSIPPIGLGLLWMLDEPQRRTWHDLLAGTVVVRESLTLEHASPDWAAAPPWQLTPVDDAASAPDRVVETMPPAYTPPPSPPAD